LTTDQAKPGIPAAGLAVLPDDRYAVTGGADGAVRVWKLPDAPTAV
jgi:WD40 repeat protein